ncbi:hypothetical protein [Pyrobaculum neutrophilum]|uniref:Uncharacterized protein n=1 Tax=Pyrobaculum neutrophilum (strain DSM 2338 / JCM 9278 / NBRC 100436 / V24Sta) TaxID=444157 RepID=B1Y948_PYRNV|nr:hypothetical protein [Pyrobaculum neutrophilum]ACB40277.1 conserved hypothetical protein [Pyrobaculum neutrophilum V24Sta]
MIYIYSERYIDVDLPQITPTCEPPDPRVIPLVGDDLRCLYAALRKSRAVALKARSRIWLALARELKPDAVIYAWGLPIRRGNVIPVYPGGEYRGPGLYYVRSRRELKALLGRAIDGVVLDAGAFDPHLVEQIVKGAVRCDCARCDVVEKLLCDVYREVEVL